MQNTFFGKTSLQSAMASGTSQSNIQKAVQAGGSRSAWWLGIALLLVATLATSCQKEDQFTNAILNSGQPAGASANALLLKPYGLPGKATQYGALICPPDGSAGWLAFQQNVAGQLGISCLRGSTQVPGNGNPPNLLTSGYNVLFNFNTSDNANGPSPFVSNIRKYKQDLKNIIALCAVKPVVAVIENEESNRYYYSGTAQEYIRQLNAAIGVMHNNGIKVTNGGITSQGLNYLVYQDFMNQGKTDSASYFKSLTRIAVKDPATQERGAFIDELLTNYYTMKIDYINFHWKGESPNTEALRMAINYLKKRSNKPIITNEIGQFDTDSNTLLAMMKLCTDQAFPYILWYSPSMVQNKKATPLQYDDAVLTNTGVAYQGYLAQ